MQSSEPPLALPHVERIVGDIESVEELLNYGYRAAWKVRANGADFVVKSDLRPGFIQQERRAHEHALSGGLPAPAVAGSLDGPPASLVLRWVEGPPLDRAESESWREAGRQLRRAHALPVLRSLDQGWAALVLEWFDKELRDLVHTGALVPGERAGALAHARALHDAMDRAPLAWLHGDCQPAHFILRPGSSEVAAIIDWADAQPGDPLMDIAVLLSSHERSEEVLEGYSATDELRRRATLLLPLYQAVRGAGSLNWLRRHGYPASTASLDAVRAFVAT